MLTFMYAVVISMTLGAALLPFLLSRGDPWYVTLTRPIGIWSVSVILYWVWGSAVGLFTPLAFNRSSGDIEVVIQAQLYFFFGACCLIAGYFIFDHRPVASIRRRNAGYQWSSWQVVIVLIVMAIGSFQLMPSNLDQLVDSEATNVQLYFIATTVLECVSWVVLFEKNRPRWLRAFVLLVILIEMFANIVQGSRSTTIYYFLPGFIAAIRIAQLVPKKKYLAPALAVLALSLAITQTVRVTYGVASFSDHVRTGGAQFVQSIADYMADQEVRSDAIGNLVETFSSSRLVAVDNLAGAIELKSQLDWAFLQGESIWTGLVSTLLPRFIFPDKPAKITAEDYFNELQGIYEDTLTNATFEFYMNFGITGILLGMFFLGLMWRWLERYFVELLPQGTSAWVSYLIFCQAILEAEQEMHIYLFAPIRTVFLVLVLGWIFSYWGQTPRAQIRSVR